MKLHHHPLSANARRAVMTAAALGADVDLVFVDLAKTEQKRPGFLRMNPNGRVPVLEDGDFVLWESHAIMLYLAEKTPGQTLLPVEPRGRADVTRWMFWTSHHFAPAVGGLNFEHLIKRFRGLGDADPREVERGERLVLDCARVLDHHLEGREWLAQDRLTLADISVATPLMALESARLPIMGGSDHRHLRAWFSRVQDLPAWKATST